MHGITNLKLIVSCYDEDDHDLSRKPKVPANLNFPGPPVGCRSLTSCEASPYPDTLVGYVSGRDLLYDRIIF